MLDKLFEGGLTEIFGDHIVLLGLNGLYLLLESFLYVGQILQYIDAYLAFLFVGEQDRLQALLASLDSEQRFDESIVFLLDIVAVIYDTLSIANDLLICFLLHLLEVLVGRTGFEFLGEVYDIFLSTSPEVYLC